MHEDAIGEIGASVERRYQDDRRLLTFYEFTDLFMADPYLLTRNSVQYVRDAIEFFGSYEVPGIGAGEVRWRVFDAEAQGGEGSVVGQEPAHD